MFETNLSKQEQELTKPSLENNKGKIEYIRHMNYALGAFKLGPCVNYMLQCDLSREYRPLNHTCYDDEKYSRLLNTSIKLLILYSLDQKIIIKDYNKFLIELYGFEIGNEKKLTYFGFNLEEDFTPLNI